MAQPSGVLAAAPSGSGDARRPCPYCGTWNEPDFSFCQKCGRQLPVPASPASTAAPSAIPPSPISSTPPAPSWTPPLAAPDSEDASVVERPLTDDERTLLKRAVKNGPAGMLRFFAAFVGIVPLFLIGMAVMGTPFVPENYIAIVLGAGFLGAILGGVSQGLRTPLVRATKAGTAHEVYGVPEVQPDSGAMSLVELGGLTLRMKSRQVAGLLPGRMNRLAFADGGAAAGARRRLGSHIAFVLESNGTPATKAEMCYLVGTPEAEAAGAVGLGRKMARGR